MRGKFGFALRIGLLVGAAALGSGLALGATKTVDLDGKTTNGAESAIDLNVLTTFPPKIETKVTNRAVGDAFTFTWKSAGPGGFTSSVPAGSTSGVGTKWVWTTAQSVYAFTGATCAKDVCFTKTAGPDPITTRGPFSVPGRSLLSTDVTLSSASLTSSLITFFSPPKEIFSITGSVSPTLSGVTFEQTLNNRTTSPVTVAVEGYPPGCCEEPGRINCNGECFDWRTDPENCGGCGIACGIGTYCSEGTCVQSCPAGLTLCDGACVDLQNDPNHCGSCTKTCGSNDICTGGTCEACRPPLQTACNNECVNIHTDAEHCGACNVDCNALCPSSGQGACSQGQSCLCIDGPSLKVIEEDLPVEEAPVCEVLPSEVTIPAGGTATECTAKSVLAKEIATTVLVCGDGIPDGEAICPDGTPATEGTFMKLVPDLLKPIGNAYLTPLAVVVDEPSKDGLIQPGETVSLKVQVLNPGSVTIQNLQGTLKSPPVDLTDDGVTNPAAVTFTTATSSFGNAVGIPAGTADCSANPVVTPAVNATAFKLTVPATHPGDVSRPFVLSTSGLVNGAPFTLDVPLSLGIANRCVYAERSGDFDAVDGLLSPLVRLVPEGDPVPFPTKPLSRGKTAPLKLRLLCGTTNLTGSDIEPPEIIALSEELLGPLDISRLNEDVTSPNSLAPFFRFSSSTKQWIFNMRTSELPTGSFTLTIRLGGKTYWTGFVLR